MGNVVGGAIKSSWHITETIFSYGYAIVESFVFIALSSLLIAWRQLTSGATEDSEADVLVPATRRVSQGPKKVVKVYYGSQTGTAKVSKELCGVHEK